MNKTQASKRQTNTKSKFAKGPNALVGIPFRWGFQFLEFVWPLMLVACDLAEIGVFAARDETDG